METIKGIQHTPPRSNSTGYTNRDWLVNCEEFVVKEVTLGGHKEIRLFFPSLSGTQIGVGLSFESPKVAVAVARALLTVTEGCTNEIRGHFID